MSGGKILPFVKKYFQKIKTIFRIHRGKNQTLFYLLSILVTLFYLQGQCIRILAQDITPHENELPEFSLNKIVVTASRKLERAIEAPAHVTIITADEIEKSGLSTLSEVLKGISGVEVNDYGPEGSLKTLSIRGSTSSQTLVLINGTRVEHSHGATDLSQIPIESIERIEVVRGGMSALYGADAIGGVVNIITKKPDKKTFSLKILNTGYIPRKYIKGYGAQTQEGGPDLKDIVDGQKLSLDFSSLKNRSGLRITGSIERASNEFIFKDTSNEDRKRINADLNTGSLYTNISYNSSSTRITLTSFTTYAIKGIPGSLDYPSSDAEERDFQLYGGLNISTNQFIAPWMTLNLSGYYHFNRLDYSDPPSIDSTHKTNTAGIDLNQEILLFPSLLPMYGLNIVYTDMNSTDTGNHNRTFTGGFIQTEVSIGEKYKIQPIVRYDYYTDFGGNLNFRFNIKRTIAQNKILKISFAKTYRAPTFNDLYWPEDAFARGNPDLKPETGYSGEIGLTATGNNNGSNTNGSFNTFNVFLFIRYIKDVILWQPQDDGKWAPTNYGRALYPGVEIDLDKSMWNGYKLGLNYTYLYSFALSGGLNLKDNKRLPYQPVHSLKTSLSYGNKRLFWKVWTTYESLKYHTTANSAYMPSHVLFNGTVNYKVNNNTQIFLTGENLFNESYQVVDGYPMPGFTFKSGMKYLF